MTDHHRGHGHAKRRGIHRDWRVWVAAIVMLGAIGIYVLTLDDSVEVMSERAADAAGTAAP